MVVQIECKKTDDTLDADFKTMLAAPSPKAAESKKQAVKKQAPAPAAPKTPPRAKKEVVLRRLPPTPTSATSISQERARRLSSSSQTGPRPPRPHLQSPLPRRRLP